MHARQHNLKSSLVNGRFNLQPANVCGRVRRNKISQIADGRQAVRLDKNLCRNKVAQLHFGKLEALRTVCALTGCLLNQLSDLPACGRIIELEDEICVYGFKFRIGR